MWKISIYLDLKSLIWIYILKTSYFKHLAKVKRTNQVWLNNLYQDFKMNNVKLYLSDLFHPDELWSLTLIILLQSHVFNLQPSPVPQWTGKPFEVVALACDVWHCVSSKVMKLDKITFLCQLGWVKAIMLTLSANIQ